MIAEHLTQFPHVHKRENPVEALRKARKRRKLGKEIAAINKTIDLFRAEVVLSIAGQKIQNELDRRAKEQSRQ